MADVRTQQARERVALALTWAPHRPGEGGFADGIAALDELADLVAVLETALRDDSLDLAAMTLAHYGDADNSKAADLIPKDVWDRLFERGHIRTVRTYTDDAETTSTREGQDWLYERLAALAGAAAEPECEHRNIHFDRSLCACGAMHNYCDDCGSVLDCELDDEDAFRAGLI